VTFPEFWVIDPGASLLFNGEPVILVKAVRDHPMARVFSMLTDLPITEGPRASVLSRLRLAWGQVVGKDGHCPPSDAEILAFETRDDPTAYYAAIVRLVSGEEWIVSIENLQIAENA